MPRISKALTDPGTGLSSDSGKPVKDLTVKKAWAKKKPKRPKATRRKTSKAVTLPPEDANTAKLRIKAFRYYSQGLTFEEVAHRLSVSVTYAKTLFRQELFWQNLMREGKLDDVRDLFEKQNAFILEAMAERVEAGDPKAFSAIVALQTMRAKLLGLNRPDKTEVSGVNGAPLTVLAPSINVAAYSTEELETLAALLAKGSTNAPDQRLQPKVD